MESHHTEACFPAGPIAPIPADALLQAFYDCAPFFMGVVELRGGEIFFVNVNHEAAVSLQALSAEAMAGRNVREFGATDAVVETWRSAYRKSRELGRPYSFESQRPLGERVQTMAVVVSAIVHPQSPCERYCFISRDISAVREVSRNLEASEERLAFALDITNEGIWDWDIPRNYVWLSEKCYLQLGYPRSVERAREFWFRLLHPDDVASTQYFLDEHLAGRNPLYSVEHRVRHADGHYVWIQSRGKVVMRDGDGKPLRMIGTQLIITERKRFELELQQAKEAAQAASDAKTAFVANISHEIRTPLTAILGFADLLQDHALSDDERQQFAQTIRRSGRHLLALINDVLDFSKIDADKMRVESLPCEPSGISSEVTSLMRARAQAKGLDYRVRLIEPLPHIVYTDPTRVRQILMNLLDNAIKFTEKGAVELTVRFETGGEDEARGDGRPRSLAGDTFAGQPSAQGRLCFDVSDTGLGLSPEGIARVFTPFVQADASTTRRFGGTGLGLSISQRLARLLGGGIDVSSSLGKGSRFTFWIAVAGTVPLETPLWPPSETPDNFPSGAGPEAGARILLVEDSQDIQVLVQHVLQNRGARVDIAPDGLQGITMARSAATSGGGKGGRGYDLILMDVQMPLMDGYTATRLLRAAGITAPIVALTADAQESRMRESRAAGCDDFFAKPIDLGHLLAMVRHHLQSVSEQGGPAAGDRL